MDYDFETLIDRSQSGSVKWNAMYKADPTVPAGIVPLSIGDMELKTPPEIVNGLKEYLDTTILGYTGYMPHDRQPLVDWCARRLGSAVDPDWLLSVDGVVPAMYLAVQTFSKAGEGILYMPPIYPPFFQAIGGEGRRGVPVPLLRDATGYHMDFARLEEAAADPQTTMLLLCSPHNPVARVWRREELQRLGTICVENQVLVVSDEIHMDFIMPGHRHHLFFDIDPALAENCIVCTAPSKTFNIAGLQIANLIIPNHKLRHRFLKAHFATGRHSANQLGLAACRIAYEQCGDWLDKACELIKHNGEMVADFMAREFPEIIVHAHEGTYFQWLDFRAWGLSTSDLEKYLNHAARLFLDEGHIFGREGEGFERFNLACPEWVLRDALARLQKAGRP